MITKTYPTAFGDAITTTEITHLNSGQVVMHIKGSLEVGSPPEVFTYEHTSTLGAEDAKDGVTGIHHCPTCGASKVLASIDMPTQAQLQTLIQAGLDAKRAEVVQVLVGRATHAAITANLT